MSNNRIFMEEEQCYEDWGIVQRKIEAYRRTVLDWIAQESILMSIDMRIKVSKCVIAKKAGFTVLAKKAVQPPFIISIAFSN